MFTLVFISSFLFVHTQPQARSERVFDLLKSGPWADRMEKNDLEGFELLVKNLETIAKEKLDDIESGMILALERAEAFGLRPYHLQTNFGILNRMVFQVPDEMMFSLTFNGTHFNLTKPKMQTSGPPAAHITEFREFRRNLQRRSPAPR